MKILLTGARGMLGQDLLETLVSAGHEVIATDRAELDITNRDAVFSFVGDQKPEVIINAAAYNFVDKVEDPAVYPIAKAINVDGPANLADAAKEHDATMIHYSTDYVFSGEKPEGYAEEDTPNPISKYGETKYLGEQAVLGSGARAFVLRLSKIFGAPGAGENTKESFVALMLRLAKEKPELQIVHEEVGSPGYTKDIAVTTAQMIAEGREPGVYHLVNAGEGVTWYQFAEEVFGLANVTTPRTPVSASIFPPRPAARPKFAPLLNTKLPPLRSRREALEAFLRDTGLIS